MYGIHCFVNSMNWKFYSLLITLLGVQRINGSCSFGYSYFEKYEWRKCSNMQRCMCGNFETGLGTLIRVELLWQWCHESPDDIVDIKCPCWRINPTQCEFRIFHFGNISHVLHELIMYFDDFTWGINYIAWIYCCAKFI